MSYWFSTVATVSRARWHFHRSYHKYLFFWLLDFIDLIRSVFYKTFNLNVGMLTWRLGWCLSFSDVFVLVKSECTCMSRRWWMWLAGFPSNIRLTLGGVCFFSHTSFADNHWVQNKTCSGAETKEAQHGEEQMQQSVTRHDRNIWKEKNIYHVIFSPCCDKENLTPRTGNNTFGVSDSAETPRRKMSNGAPILFSK